MHRVRPESIRPVRRPLLARTLATALALPLLAGCGEEEPLPQSCVQANPAEVLSALRRAPGRVVALPDGTLLSACIDRAESDAELQTLGISFVTVADRLGAQVERDRDAAFRLGFLLGAAERGAGPTGGTQAELVQRLEQAVAFRTDDAARNAEVMRGVAAGREAG